MSQILHETHDTPAEAFNRTLISYKVYSDETMIEFHKFMLAGYDIITQFELEGIVYILLQKVEQRPLQEVLEAEKAGKLEEAIEIDNPVDAVVKRRGKKKK